MNFYFFRLIHKGILLKSVFKEKNCTFSPAFQAVNLPIQYNDTVNEKIAQG
jgi:hypothetical protein